MTSCIAKTHLPCVGAEKELAGRQAGKKAEVIMPGSTSFSNCLPINTKKASPCWHLILHVRTMMLPRCGRKLTSRKIGINRPSSSSTASKVLLHSNEQMQVNIRKLCESYLCCILNLLQIMMHGEALVTVLTCICIVFFAAHNAGHLQMTMHSPDNGWIPGTKW